MSVTAREVAVCSPVVPLRPLPRLRMLLVPLCVATAVVIASVWLMRPGYAVDLSGSQHLSQAGLLQRWKQGDVVVLVRHAERCDQSSNACLADASGITIDGSETASQVGAAFKQLGMQQTDVFSSPLTRTLQTTAFMFGKTVATQDWLAGCKSTLERDMLAHKTAHRNLLLVTHSTCINELGDQLEHATASYNAAYASALFVAVDSKTGKPSLLGYMNADGWAKVMGETAL